MRMDFTHYLLDRIAVGLEEDLPQGLDESTVRATGFLEVMFAQTLFPKARNI